MTNKYEFGEDYELDLIRANRNISKALAGKVGRTEKKKSRGICSFCGLETWACSHGGHCYSKKERKEWEKKFGKSTNYKGFPKD